MTNLKQEDGSFRLPHEAGDMLDGLVLHITDRIQEGADGKTVVTEVHDLCCYWLHNAESEEDVAERKRKMN